MVLINKRDDRVYDIISKLLTEKGYSGSYGVRGTTGSISKIKEEMMIEIEDAL